MDINPYSYEDLVLVETFAKLQRELELVALRVPYMSTKDKYLYLCHTQQQRPSEAYLEFLRIHGGMTNNDEDEDTEPEVQVFARHAGRSAPAGHLAFQREYMCPMVLLPILATLPECAGSLRSLDLSNCNLTSAAVQLLCCKALATGRLCLQSIDISRNQGCGTVAVEALLQLVLRHASICKCDIHGIHSIGPINRRLDDAVQQNCASA